MKFPNKVTNHIVNWLEDYLKKSNMDGFVIGVSGGVDSERTFVKQIVQKFINDGSDDTLFTEEEMEEND